MQQNNIGLKARLREKQGIKDPAPSIPVIKNISSAHNTTSETTAPLNSGENFPELITEPVRKQSIGAWAKGIDTIRRAVNIPAPASVKPQPVKADNIKTSTDMEDDTDTESETSIDQDWGDL